MDLRGIVHNFYLIYTRHCSPSGDSKPISLLVLHFSERSPSDVAELILSKEWKDSSSLTHFDKKVFPQG